MMTAARIRAIRAYLGESQLDFGARFKQSRYTVIHWEKYGIVDHGLERAILKLERPADAKSARRSPPE
jgi:DNA-binding transcriptional regulator YiaG